VRDNTKIKFRTLGPVGQLTAHLITEELNQFNKAITRVHIRTLIGGFFGTQKDLADCPTVRRATHFDSPALCNSPPHSLVVVEKAASKSWAQGDLDAESCSRLDAVEGKDVGAWPRGASGFLSPRVDW
jgi:hypothetical protein